MAGTTSEWDLGPGSAREPLPAALRDLEGLYCEAVKPEASDGRNRKPRYTDHLTDHRRESVL